MCRSRVFRGSILRTELDRVSSGLDGRSVFFILDIAHLCIIKIHFETVSREYVLRRVFIGSTVPLLYDPVLERQFVFTFRSSCRRACDCLCLIGILVRIGGSVGSLHGISVAVLAHRSVDHIDAVRTIQDPSPAGVEVDLSDSSRIFRIISGIGTIKGIQFSIFAYDGVVHGERVEVPHFGKTFIGEPTGKIVEIPCSADIADLLAVVDPDHVSIRSIVSGRISIDILEGLVSVFLGMEGDLVLLEHPPCVNRDTTFRHLFKGILLGTLIIGIPAEEHIVRTIRNLCGRIIGVECAYIRSICNTILVLSGIEGVCAVVFQDFMGSVFV